MTTNERLRIVKLAYFMHHLVWSLLHILNKIFEGWKSAGRALDLLGSLNAQPH